MTVQDEVFSEKLVKTFFVRDDGEVTIICPACSKTKNISVRDFRQRQYRGKVRCSCLQVFGIKLDYRKTYRKPINIPGAYTICHPVEDEGAVTIKDLSFRGICFEILGNHSLCIGQRGSIDFTLDNKKQTRLTKEFVIRSVNSNKFGCEFVKDQAYEKDLGFYLRPGL